MSLRVFRPLACALALGCIVPAWAAGLDVAPTANIHYDVVRFDADDTRLRDDDAFRRLRLGFKAKNGPWQLVAEHDFADRTPADAFVEYTPAKGHAVRVGQFKQPFSLEDAISDKQAPFLETSLLGTYAIGRRIGLEYSRHGDRGVLNVAAFGQRLDGTLEGRGLTARGAWVLRRDARGLLQLGASLATDTPDLERASFSASPGTALTSVRSGSSGSLAGVDRIDRGAVEALWVRGAGSLQAEWGRVAVQRDGRPDYATDAQAVVATWSPTGHSRSWKRGIPGGPSGANGVNGAWELAARWSAIDLDDAGIHGGRVASYGLAASYFPNPHLRIAANLVRTSRAGGADAPLLAALRVQLTY
ncbi:OprO/OprP family phosphate-selective porin [Lysobacter humi (ex Lee et al. 2017)]